MVGDVLIAERDWSEGRRREDELRDVWADCFAGISAAEEELRSDLAGVGSRAGVGGHAGEFGAGCGGYGAGGVVGECCVTQERAPVELDELCAPFGTGDCRSRWNDDLGLLIVR